jgi:ABC-2 type transport system ATP-binding protein
MKAITIDNLSKIYPTGKKAVDSLFIDLEEGEVFGFLGPNGAGKTTTVKILNGILEPTTGVCEVLGINPASNPVETHQVSGIVTEHAAMYGDKTGIDNLIFYGTVFGKSAEDSKKRGLYLLEKLELLYAKDQKLETYSTGMRQRLSLARALIHNPQVLFLDEPTSGLDPESILSVNKMIQTLAYEEKVTVFLCTHQLRYAEEICTSYGLINDGILLATGTLDALRKQIFDGVKVEIKTNLLPQHLSAKLTAPLTYEFELPSENHIPDIIKEIVNDGGKVYGVNNHKLSLEEIYMSLLDIQSANSQRGVKI